MVLTLYSKKQIIKILKEHMNEYNYVLIIRPDLRIDMKYNFASFIQALKKVDNHDVIIPHMDCFAGCNDTVGFMSIETALYYGSLFNQLLDYSKDKSLISEKYLLDMLNYQGLKIIYRDDMKYTTIRANKENQK
jgi:hypothetical protein